MARHEADREDLYEEFRSAVMKWEILIDGTDQMVVAGIRKDGRTSLYFSQDDCFHFNDELQLLRAYVAGDLYRTQGTTLARLRRVRTEEQTELRRHDLSENELSELLAHLKSQIGSLLKKVEQRSITVVRAQPEQSELDHLRAKLQRLSGFPIQLAAAYPTRR